MCELEFGSSLVAVAVEAPSPSASWAPGSCARPQGRLSSVALAGTDGGGRPLRRWAAVGKQSGGARTGGAGGELRTGVGAVTSKRGVFVRR